MEGLKIREVSVFECLQQSEYRFEAEFWIQTNNPQSKTVKGCDIIDFVQYGTSKELIEEKEGFPVLRLNEFDSQFIGIPSKYCKLISENDFENLKLKKNDVLICRTNGNPNLVGKSALVAKDTEYAYASYLFKIRPKKEIINAATFVAFLNCRYGRKEIDKYSMTSNQTNFSPAKFREIEIPLFSQPFNDKIDGLYSVSFKNLNDSKTFYSQAEELLLETIGLKDFQPTQENKSIKSFSESFLATGRLDAEYYQPKYEEIENRIKTLSHACLSELVTFINHGKQPPYIENGTVRVFSQKWIGDKSINYSFLEATDEPFTSEEFAAQNSKYVARKNDILYYSVGANLGYCHNYLLDEPIMPGSFITLVRTNNKKVNPIYLGMVLNSLVGRFQAEKCKSASAQPYIYPKDISEFIIPLIENEVQQQIAALVEKSFYLCGESKRLLDDAKDLVEREIEK